MMAQGFSDASTKAGALRIDYFYKTASGDTADPCSYEFPMHFVHIDGWSFEYVQQGNKYNSEERLDSIAGFDEESNELDADPAGEAEVVSEKVQYKTSGGFSRMEVYIVKSKSQSARASIRKKLAVGVEYLLNKGAVAITGDCGFCVYFQKAIVEIVARRAPVMMSSLLLAPTMPLMYSETSRFVVCTANSKKLNLDVIFGIIANLEFGSVEGKTAAADKQSDLIKIFASRFRVAGFEDVEFGVKVAEGLPVIYSEEMADTFVCKIREAAASFPDGEPSGIIFECTEMGMFTCKVRDAFPKSVVLNSVNTLEIARLGQTEDTYGHAQ